MPGKFDQSASRASGNRTEEEGREIAYQVGQLNTLLSPVDPSRAGRLRNHETWLDAADWHIGRRDQGGRASHSVSNSSKPLVAPPTLKTRFALQATALGRKRSLTTTTVSTPTKFGTRSRGEREQGESERLEQEPQHDRSPAVPRQEWRSKTEYATGQGIEDLMEISSTEKSRLCIESQMIDALLVMVRPRDVRPERRFGVRGQHAVRGGAASTLYPV